MKKLTLAELRNAQSPYFCGSACLMSLYEKMNIVLGETVGIKKEISELKKKIVLLEHDDAKLFKLTYVKTGEPIDYELITEILNSYCDFFSRFNDIISVLKDCHKEELVSMIKLDFDFLLYTILDSNSYLIENEDCPLSFKRVIHELMMVERKL